MAELGDSTLLNDYQRRTRELEALFETAGDLSALRDVDQVLSAIVRRGRQLLASDVAYLMLLDDERREAYMRIGEGIQTPQFLDIKLAYGEGLGGLVAGTGMPQWTSDYFDDPRFAPSIDSIVRDEALVSILGVPLKVGTRVTGVLFASDRRHREYSHDEVALLVSLANHAAIALENASLFQASQEALRKWQEASLRIEQHNRMLERAAELHETLTSLVLKSAPLPALADTVADGLGGRVVVLDEAGSALTPGDVPAIVDSDCLRQAATRSGGSLELVDGRGDAVRVAPAKAGTRLLGYLLYEGESLPEPDVRALERAALVTALLLLDRRARDDARTRAMAELLSELEAGADEERARRRAEAAGVTVPRPPYVIAVALAAPSSLGSDELERGRIGEAMRLVLDEGMLGRVQGREAIVVVTDDDAGNAARTLADRLRDLHGEPVTVGTAGPYSQLGQATRRTARARTCAKVLENTGRTGRGAAVEELGVYTLLFSDVGRDRIEAFVEEAIGPVLRYDAERDAHLLTTLKAYFDTGGQTGRLAETLYVHVNTVYQRLERIDRLIGEGWRRGEHSLQVHLATRLELLLADQEPTM